MSDRRSETPEEVREAARHFQEVQERMRREKAEKKAREEAERQEREEAARRAEATRLAEEVRKAEEDRMRTEAEKRAGKRKATNTPEAGAPKRSKKANPKTRSEPRIEHEDEEEEGLDAPCKR